MRRIGNQALLLAGSFLVSWAAAAGISAAQTVFVPAPKVFGVTTDLTLGGRLGSSVDLAGDVNNDGFLDYIAGAPQAATAPGEFPGSASVISGADGSILHTLWGEASPDQFGQTVSGVGDVNSDGFDDVVVGAPFNNGNAPVAGSAYVFSGATAAVLYTFSSSVEQARFATSVSGAGDVDNDGVPDIIVGSLRGSTGSGEAQVFSGATGATLYIFQGDDLNDGFGSSVSGAGDVNNDGFDDLIVGAPGDDNNGTGSGSARVFSGANGAVLYAFDGDSAQDAFGGAVSAAGDVNNDGFDDVIVGAPNDDNITPSSGSARVYSGASGAVLYTFNGAAQSDGLGISVSGAGDVNNDGFDDLIAGAHRADINGLLDSGSALVYSGATGSILFRLALPDSMAGDLFGSAVSGAGDVNNDGFDDVIVGARFADSPAPVRSDVGAVVLFYSDLPYAWSNKPAPCPGDADGNGVVEFADIGRVLVNFGSMCP